jgi:hypothetical protein
VSEPQRTLHSKTDFLPKIELAFGIAVTAVVVVLHFVLLFNSGGLWRDEINTVALASMPQLADTWNNLQFDSFPMLWFLVLRTWMTVFTSDLGLRMLGCLVGIGIVGMLWCTARRFKLSVPLFSLTLLAVSPALFRIGDSLRAYGFGVLLFLVMLNCVWAMMQSATRSNIIVAAVAAVLSVHALFYNAVLLLAVGCAGIFVCARDGKRKEAAILLGIGMLAAVSLLPYVSTIKGAADWNVLVHIREYSLSYFFKKFSQATGADLVWFWAALTFFAVVTGITPRSKNSDVTDETPDVARFGVAMLIIGGVAYFGFLKVLKYYTQPWYYLSLMALVAVALDLVFSNCTNRRWRGVRLGVATLLAALSLPSVWAQSQTRHTTVELIAENLEKNASPDDLILINPWYYSITFQRYYDGSTPWMSVPPLEFFKFHRYDLIKEKMQAPTQVEIVQPLFEEINETLRNGNTVWICGGVDFVEEGQVPPILPPAPHPEHGWAEELYANLWALHVGFHFQQYATNVQWIDFTNQPVSTYEDPPLGVVRGWRPVKQP